MRPGGIQAAAREVALIVLGILIAFSLDAAWDVRQLRQVEQDLLRSLRSEMEFNLLELGVGDSLRAAGLEAARRLFSLTGPAAAPRPFAEIEALLLRTAEGTVTYDPRTGTVNAIVGGGRMELVRNDSLRLALASWQEQLRDVREEEDRCIEYLLQQFWPYLEGRVVLPTEGSPWEGAFDETTTTELLRDVTFAKHVAQQMHRLRLTLDDAADLRALILDILGLVRFDLDDP
jgi:hypothetical protein